MLHTQTLDEGIHADQRQGLSLLPEGRIEGNRERRDCLLSEGFEQYRRTMEDLLSKLIWLKSTNGPGEE